MKLHPFGRRRGEPAPAEIDDGPLHLSAILREAMYMPVMPHTMDFEVTGQCPYRCAWCYGPQHAVRGTLDAPTYGNISRTMAQLGTLRFVITGGEPLLRPDIEDIIAAIPDSVQCNGEELPITLTLSTSGAGLLDRHARVLDLLAARKRAEVGLPEDGPDAESNSAMRPAANPSRNGRNFGEVIDILKVLQSPQYSHIDRKLRTVVTSRNQFQIGLIPESLEDYGVDTRQLHWKIYQVNPYVGPRTEAIASERWRVSDNRFKLLGGYLVRRFNNRFTSVKAQLASEAADNYTFMGPQGMVRTVKNDLHGSAVDVEVGNIIENPVQTVLRLSSLDYAPYYAFSPEARKYLARMARM